MAANSSLLTRLEMRGSLSLLASAVCVAKQRTRSMVIDIKNERKRGGKEEEAMPICVCEFA